MPLETSNVNQPDFTDTLGEQEQDDTPLFERDGYELPEPPKAPAPKKEDKDTEEEEPNPDDESDDTDEEAEGDDEAGDDEGKGGDEGDDIAKIEAARQKALKMVGEDEEAQDEINKRFDALETEVKKAKAGDTTAADKEWWEEGSQKKPPSWAAIYKKAKDDAKKELVEELGTAAKQQQAQQAKIHKQIDAEIDALVEEKLIKEDEAQDLVKFAIEVGAKDLFHAVRGFRKINRRSAEVELEDDQEEDEGMEERKRTARKVSRRRGRGAPRGTRLSYQQLHQMDMDDVVEHARLSFRRKKK